MTILAHRAHLFRPSNRCHKQVTTIHDLGFEKLSEFRTTLKADLGGPAEIPKQDLAIYVSVDDERVRGFKEAFEQQITALPEALPEPAPEKVPHSAKPIVHR